MSERNEQQTIFAWASLQSNSIKELDLLFAIPNGQVRRGHRIEPGIRKGVPDMCLPVARDGFHGLYIELKYGDNKPTEEQTQWIDKLTEQGYLAVVSWGAMDAIENICEYLGIPKDEFSWA